MMIEINPRNTVQGRPRTTGGVSCARCGRSVGKIRTCWPEGRICGICFHHAMRTRGACGSCGDERLLPGRDNGGTAICATCASIPILPCTRCHEEAEHYRRGICARCALRNDLHHLMDSQSQDFVPRLIDVLAAADRPDSVLTWLRSDQVKLLLQHLANGEVPLTHEALDAEPANKRVEHLRSLLDHHGFLPHRDHHLALFERWLETKLAPVADPAIRQPVEQFARWHHLFRIRARSTPGTASRGPVHSAKQEITETLKFLTWLRDEHARHLPACRQQDIDAYLAAGPTTRTAIRTFFVWLFKDRTTPRHHHCSSQGKYIAPVEPGPATYLD